MRKLLIVAASALSVFLVTTHIGQAGPMDGPQAGQAIDVTAMKNQLPLLLANEKAASVALADAQGRLNGISPSTPGFGQYMQESTKALINLTKASQERFKAQRDLAMAKAQMQMLGMPRGVFQPIQNTKVVSGVLKLFAPNYITIQKQDSGEFIKVPFENTSNYPQVFQQLQYTKVGAVISVQCMDPRNCAVSCNLNGQSCSEAKPWVFYGKNVIIR